MADGMPRSASPGNHDDPRVYNPVVINDMHGIDVGTSAMTQFLRSAETLEQNGESSGSSEEYSSRDMSVSQSQNNNNDIDHGTNGSGVDVMTISASEADISIQSSSNQSPKPELELSSPLPDDMVSSPMGTSTPNPNDTQDDHETYKCRFCHFLARNYTQLQVHMPTHAGLKALNCTLCDYATNDKSNFKRHKRLHIRVNPVNVIKCDKCTYTTILPRKIREHYRQQHNTIYTCHHPEFPESPVKDTMCPRLSDMPESSSHGSHISFQNLDVTLGQTLVNRTVPVAPSALHSLLTAVRPSQLEYVRPQHVQNHPISHNLGQYFEGYDSHAQQSLAAARVQEPHMASNYLRSIVSTVMPTPLHRIAPTSTITSSSYYLTQAGAGQRHMSIPTHQVGPLLSTRDLHVQQLGHAVKVKQEPVDMVMDAVSSSGGSSRTPEPVRYYDDRTNRLQRRESLEPPDSGSYISLDRGNEAVPSTFTSRVGSSDSDPRHVPHRDDRYFNGENRRVPQPFSSVKTEVSSIGVQCAMPVVKAEPADRRVSTENHKLRLSRNTIMLTERGTQCELIQSSRCSTQLSQSESCGSESESSEQQGSTSRDSCTKCAHCGVTFDDEVLYSIHIGCHSHTDPFVCNVCGRQCHNKYGFYSHIMRGHQCQ